MTFEDFAKQIKFRFFGKMSNMNWFNRLNNRLTLFGINLEILNTCLPTERNNARSALKKLVRSVPKMSTFANAALIDKAVSDMPNATKFVNVGVWHGYSFLAGIVSNKNRECVAIDNFSQFGNPKIEFMKRFDLIKSPNHYFYETNYENYFANIHSGLIGFYIYDGDHIYQEQMRGLEVAEPFFATGCVILVDDTNDPEPRQATLDFINRHPTRYRILFDHKTLGNGHPTHWNGVMIFQRIE